MLTCMVSMFLRQARSTSLRSVGRGTRSAVFGPAANTVCRQAVPPAAGCHAHLHGEHDLTAGTLNLPSVGWAWHPICGLRPGSEYGMPSGVAGRQSAGRPASLMRPRSNCTHWMACWSSSVALARRSFFLMFSRWVSTVLMDRWSFSATWRVWSPWPISSKTSSSRSDSTLVDRAVRSSRLPASLLRSARAHLLGEVDFSGQNLSDGGDDVVGGFLLHDVSAGPGADDPLGVEALVVHGQRKRRQVGLADLEVLDQFQPGGILEGQVDHGDVRLGGLDALEGLGDVLGFAADGQVVLQVDDAGQALA